MTTDDQGKEERLEEIKREEKEDASDYYSQGASKDNMNEEAEFNKPVTPIEKEQEEMNMLKAVAFLGFGMAALAIIFILFFVRDLDTRVVGMDGAVTSLEEKIAPLQKQVDDGFGKVNEDISGLKTKVGNYERMMAVMELKRALVTVQGMSMGDSPNVKAKSGEVVAGIEALLTELGAGPTATKSLPAGIVSLEEAPAAPAVVEEPATHAEEPAAVESAPAEEAPVHAEEPATAESVPELEASEEAAPAEEAVESAESEEKADDAEEEEEEDEEDEDK
jgi:hypothetical protein